MRTLATALALLALPLVTTAQTVTPTMPDNKPLVSGSNLIFTFQTTGISFGKGASIELHPQGSPAYDRFGCLYDNATYPPADYVCTVNAAGLSGDYQNTTVEYQTFVSDYNNPNSGTSNFSGFVYSYPTNGSNLPVELTAFTATTNGTSARLAWTTASETNNAGFTVEQQNGETWTERGFVAGRGTTTERSDYAFDVTGLTAGSHAFRLRQTDTDGAVHYSPVVTVEVGVDGASRVTLLGQQAVRVETNEAQAVRVRVFDVLGRAVSSQQSNVSGTGVFVLPSMAAGAYVVRVEGERFAQTRTLVVR